MKIIPALLLHAMLAAWPLEAARCTGKADCRACRNCTKCVWCKPLHQQKGVPPLRLRHCGVCAPSFS